LIRVLLALQLLLGQAGDSAGTTSKNAQPNRSSVGQKSGNQPNMSIDPTLPAMNVYILIDASGSMNQCFHGEMVPKITAVRIYVHDAVTTLVSNPRINIFLRAFGPPGCGGIAKLATARMGQTKYALLSIAALSAHGPSSLAVALLDADEEMAELPGDRTLILISDGKDRCGGDITTLKLDQSITRHVLGLDVDADTAGKLLEIGDYTEIKSSQDLSVALSRIVDDILGSLTQEPVHSTSRYRGIPNKSLSTSSK